MEEQKFGEDLTLLKREEIQHNQKLMNRVKELFFSLMDEKYERAEVEFLSLFEVQKFSLCIMKMIYGEDSFFSEDCLDNIKLNLQNELQLFGCQEFYFRCFFQELFMGCVSGFKQILGVLEGNQIKVLPV
eukprot:snap_masked-scaffold_90-processed-gene-0.19-mRNA-1 protein AED:1.00 eAED:1.00 QI:0/0/0/0/1/1/2/0/129